MGEHADKPWYQQRVAPWIERCGAVPPPWVYAENSHPYSIRWRMGEGETHCMVFGEWFEANCPTEAERIKFFRRWPAPPRWLAIMADWIWDLEPWEEAEEFDYAPYFQRLTELGFAGAEEYERDLNDEKWLELDG